MQSTSKIFVHVYLYYDKNNISVIAISCLFKTKKGNIDHPLMIFGPINTCNILLLVKMIFKFS